MFEDIRHNISRLIALYEAERERNQALAQANKELEDKLAAGQKQIAELEEQIDILKLRGAFGGGKNTAAKETIDKLIKEIDKCISLLKS